MRLDACLETAKERSLRPGTWGAVLLFGLLWNLLGPGAEPGRLLVPFLLGAFLLILAPLPWQWTGDARPAPDFPRGLAQSMAWNLVAVGLAFLLMPGAGRGPMAHRGMMPGPPMHGPLPFPFWHLRFFILGVATFAFGVFLGRVLAQRDQEGARANAAEREARAAQTRALQAQMNPHVLFNTISGLAELAREDPAATEEALVQLADLMRGLLEHSGRTLAPLARERALVEGLLALERFRLGDRLRVTWAWDAALEDVQVPPLLLQPLVENAIKHGVAPSRSGGELEIGLAGERRSLRLWVANTGRPLEEGRPDGVGLGNLRQRLALMPGRPGSLALRQEGGRTLAELRLEPERP